MQLIAIVVLHQHVADSHGRCYTEQREASTMIRVVLQAFFAFIHIPTMLLDDVIVISMCRY